MRRHALLALLAAAVIAGAGLWAADDTPSVAAKQELKKLEGTWRVSAMERDGQKVPEADFKDLRAIVQGTTYTQKKGTETVEKGTFRIDVSRKPYGITITPTQGEDKGKKMQGIYEIESADTIRVCGAAPGKERPTDFSAKTGSGRTLVTYKRVQSK